MNNPTNSIINLLHLDPPKVPTSCTTITEFQPVSDTILTVRTVDADDPSTPNGQVHKDFKLKSFKVLVLLLEQIFVLVNVMESDTILTVRAVDADYPSMPNGTLNSIVKVVVGIL